MYTDLHLNRYWRLFQEVFVIVHGGTVAWQTGGPDLEGTRLWPMFVFGFSLCFVLTQVVLTISYIYTLKRNFRLTIYIHADRVARFLHFILKYLFPSVYRNTMPINTNQQCRGLLYIFESRIQVLKSKVNAMGRRRFLIF